MKTDHKNQRRIQREAKIEWVPLGLMRVPPEAQRKFRPHWANEILANFKPEEIGKPTVNSRGGFFYVIDGQHRIWALKEFLGQGWEGQQIQCEVYDGLTEAEAADKFLLLNTRKAVNVICQFKVAVTAGWVAETEINNVIQKEGMKISADTGPGSIKAVATVCGIYKKSDGPTLGRTLRIIREAYGDSGLDASVIGGIGELCIRYNGQLKDVEAIERLREARGGVSGLLSKAELLRKQTGNSKNNCVAAAAVDIINCARRGGNKLPTWWKMTAKD